MENKPGYAPDTTTVKIPTPLRDKIRKICIINNINVYDFMGNLLDIVPEKYIDEAIAGAKKDKQTRNLARLEEDGEGKDSG